MLSGEIAPNINILVFAIHLTWHLHKCPLMSHFKLEYRQAALSTDWKRNVGVVWVRYKATKSIIQSVPHWSLWSKAVGTPLVSNHQVWSICSLWLRQTFQGYLTSKRMIPYQVYLLVLPYRHSVKKKATTHNLLCELYGYNGQRYRVLREWQNGFVDIEFYVYILLRDLLTQVDIWGCPHPCTKERGNRNICKNSHTPPEGFVS